MDALGSSKNDASKPTKADAEAVLAKYQNNNKVNTRRPTDDELTIEAFKNDGSSKQLTFKLDK